MLKLLYSGASILLQFMVFNSTPVLTITIIINKLILLILINAESKWCLAFFTLPTKKSTANKNNPRHNE